MSSRRRFEQLRNLGNASNSCGMGWHGSPLAQAPNPIISCDSIAGLTTIAESRKQPASTRTNNVDVASLRVPHKTPCRLPPFPPSCGALPSRRTTHSSLESTPRPPHPSVAETGDSSPHCQHLGKDAPDQSTSASKLSMTLPASDAIGHPARAKHGSWNDGQMGGTVGKE
jgi:hypothetical protein